MRASLAFTLVWLAGPLAAQSAESPLSAIDWLDEPAPVLSAPQAPSDPESEPPVATGVSVPEITVKPIGDGTAEQSVGLLPTHVTGLPETLWQRSSGASLGSRIERSSFVSVPALQKLLYTMMLAEALPPAGMEAEQFLTVRAAKLTEFGVIEPAEALVERLPLESPAHFDLWFDLTLYAGLEDKACDKLNEKRALSTSYGAQIFCALRGGDWEDASFLFDTADALGLLRSSERRLLLAFLDPEYAEASPQMPPPRNITPLEFRLFEATGNPLPSSNLPVAFAAADLRELSGWKAQLEAAERLVRNAALSPNVLLGLYTERKPAASGGVWERARAIQALESALENGNAEETSAALHEAYDALGELGLEYALAEIYVPELEGVSLTPKGEALRFMLTLMTQAYETAKPGAATDPKALFLSSLAQGTPKGAEALNTQLALALQDGFTSAAPEPSLARMMQDGKLGEAILVAASQMLSGLQGDFSAARSGVAGLRQMGLEDVTRRAALQMAFAAMSE